MNIKPERLSDAVTLYEGQCEDVLPYLTGIDAVITDPPYGIAYNPKIHKRYNGEESRFDLISGDAEEINLRPILEMKCPVISWGAGNYPNQLPHRGRWLCWHKRSYETSPNTMPSSDFELAWVNWRTGFYKYKQVIHGGCVNDDSAFGNNAPRFHPTQKPIALMRWCIQILDLIDTDTILDPFAGSGTTAVAAILEGRRCILIEKDPHYCDIIRRRIAEAEATGPTSLFKNVKHPELFAGVAV